jgi:hypothetical protein
VAHRIGGQRVEPAAQHSTILYPSPAPLGWTRSTVSERQRWVTIVPEDAPGLHTCFHTIGHSLEQLSNLE